MLDIFHSSGKADKLVIFIHGLQGNESTWLNKTGKTFPQLLIEQDTVGEQFDFAFFNYYTQIFTPSKSVKWGTKILYDILGKAFKLKKNLHINEIADLLSTYLSEYAKKYKTIVLVCHSMGGLVAKSLIAHHPHQEIVKRIKLIISLAVPHNSSNLASIGEKLLSNVQIKNLVPLEADISKINKVWILGKDSNPRIIYFQGKYDDIVIGTSSVGYDANEPEIKFCDDDHQSIAKPESSNALVCVSVRNALQEIIRQRTASIDIRSTITTESVKSDSANQVIVTPFIKDGIIPVGSRVFISYTHDSQEHRERVRELADRLVKEGINCWCDQYVEDGAPARGWPLWMEDNVRAADFVLVICTELYLNRYEGREASSVGLGAKFEAVLLTQDMYDKDSENRKVIAVLFEESDKIYIPFPFRAYTRYCIADETGYDGLYARLTKQVPNMRPPIGTMRHLLAPSSNLPDKLVSEQGAENYVQQSPIDREIQHLPIIPEFTTDTMHPNLKIAQAFFGQSVTTRFALASKLHLLEPGETQEDVNKEEVSTKILLRAKSQGVLDKLWSNLFNENLDPNPFLH